MDLKVIDIKGKDTGNKVSLSDDVFAIEPNDHAIYLDVKRTLAAKHLGLHKAKEKGEVKASTRKVKRQKGTGTARMGSLKSGVLRGGGRMFGPRVRNYDISLNKKVKAIARKSALTYKANDKAITVIDSINFEAPKTKEYISMLNNLKLNGAKTLLVLDDQNKNVYLASRNLKNAKVAVASDINTYDILNAKNLIFVEGAVKKVEEILLNK